MNFFACCGCYEKYYSDTLISYANGEKQIKEKTYNSPHDDLFSFIEFEYNYISKFQLIEFVNYLAYYKDDNATIDKKIDLKFSFLPGSFDDIISAEQLNNLVENSKRKFPDLKIDKPDEDMQLFKIVSNAMYKGVQLRFIKKNKDFKMKKINLLPLGVLYAKSDVGGKVKFIFDVFSEDKKISKESKNFQDYILGSFLLSSFTIVYCGYHLEDTKKNLNKDFTKNDFVNGLLKIYKLENCETLLDEFNKFFFTNNSLDWQAFREKFEMENGFQWILSPKGIRAKLNKIQKEQGKNLK